MISRVLTVDFSQPYKRGEALDARVLERIEEIPTKLKHTRHPMAPRVLEMLESRIRITPFGATVARPLSADEANVMERVIAPYALVGTRRMEDAFAGQMWANIGGSASGKDRLAHLTDIVAAWGSPSIGETFAERIHGELVTAWREISLREPPQQVWMWTIQLVLFLTRPCDVAAYEAARRRVSA